MQQTDGAKHSLPAGYRIALAMSAAVLAHTLLLSGFPSPFEETDDARHRVSVELVAPGAVTRPERPAATALANSRNPRFEVAPLQTKTTPSRSEPALRSTSDSSVSTKPQAQASATSAPSKPAAGATASTASRAGEQATLVEPRPVATTTRITESPDEQDPYLIKLAVHLGHELEKLRVPAIAQLSERVAMEIELQLLNNGALTRAKVLKSTGLKRIDDAAYRASLAASPYPEPPVGGQSRFEIELVFSPNRF
ncbi:MULTISPECIES: TonB family protein [Marinobacter]|jgi:protein TonB|uniref:TonB family protein n=1 Tax=Marinobacter TaxID=2742 RepID=UPI001FFFFACE|nr:MULTISPECIES: TonB family protein [Marinobacter]MCK2149236.1 TonB family protein [Marinobacter alexandrii]